jgi:hypothetical protein
VIAVLIEDNHVPPERWFIFVPQGAMSQKMTISITTAVKTSNPVMDCIQKFIDHSFGKMKFASNNEVLSFISVNSDAIDQSHIDQIFFNLQIVKK